LNRLYDKLILLLISMVCVSSSASLAAPVVVLLVSVLFSSLVQLFSGRYASAALIMLFSALCGPFPLLLCALPIMFYDALYEKKWWTILPASLIFFIGDPPSFGNMMLTAAGMLTALVIYRRVSVLENSVESLSVLRDEGKEKNIQLREQNVRLIEAQDNAVRLATLQERNRIAREIHDNVGHMLTRSLLQSGALLIINKDEKMTAPLQSLKETLDTAMTSIRESVHDLHDESIDLKKSIEESLRPAEEKFHVESQYDAGDGIPGNVRLCVIGVVKECVSNTIKHSSGDRITLIFREHPGFYQLLFEDNGPAGAIKETGIGLKNMEDRAAGVGGNISFTPSENGFRVFMSIPKK